MRKILVTGGAGFIGSAIVKKLIESKDNHVVVVDNLLTGDLNRLDNFDGNNWKFIRCDVNNYDDVSQVFFSYKFDYVFHLAAVVGVERTQRNPVLVMSDIKGIENILNLSKNTGVKRVFFSSSSEVYGEPVEFPQNEITTPLNSRVPYAIVKNVGEAFMRSFQKEYGLEYTIFRYFNTYGIKQSKDFVVSRFISMALNNKDITIYGDGSQTRTFCYVDDNVEACLKVFNENLFINNVINIGNDVEVSIIQLAEMIIELANSKSKIINTPPLKEGDMKRRLPDNTKMREVLVRDLLPLKDGLKKLIDTPDYFI